MNDRIKELLKVYDKDPSNMQSNVDLASEYWNLGQ